MGKHSFSFLINHQTSHSCITKPPGIFLSRRSSSVPPPCLFLTGSLHFCPFFVGIRQYLSVCFCPFLSVSVIFFLFLSVCFCFCLFLYISVCFCDLFLKFVLLLVLLISTFQEIGCLLYSRFFCFYFIIKKISFFMLLLSD